MKSTLFPLLALLLANSCTIRIYTNDRLIRKEKGIRTNEPPTNDFCFVLGPSARIPQGAVYVNNTRLRTSEIYFGEEPAKDLLIRWAKEEARSDGANTIVIYEDS